MHGSGLEGPIPPSISLLRNLTELRISDLSGEGSLFPNISSMKSMSKLMLRSCNITGRLPDYMPQMPELKHVDLSFNSLYGDIPDLSKLHDLQNLYLTGNSFNSSVPDWLTHEAPKRAVDLSYNDFSEESVLTHCGESLNLFRSYSSQNDSDLGRCLSSYPCLKDYNSIHINCGGTNVTIGGKTYEADQDRVGAATFRPSNDHWGFSSTGNVLDLNSTEYSAQNVSMLTMNDYELYTAARVSPLSVTYYGRCLANGRYRVTLHFAEIVFRDNRSFQSLGRRAFDVYVQGVIKLKNFDIKNEAGGVDKAVIRKIENIHVTNKTLEIRFQYAGKGTTVVPKKGVFGPMISAISMESAEPKSSKRIIFIAIGAVAATLCLILIVLGIAWWRHYIGNQTSREKDLKGLDLQTGVFTYRQIKAATDNFADSNKLGEGGFGSVYKGTLLDGTHIAVKKLSSKSNQGNREFVNEIGMIAAIQHPNIVRLHGCCVKRNHLLLVYEYMENNSLAHALFEKDESKMEIDFRTRQQICVGIAKGLRFLHEESVLRMVHRDIKATNILLDTDFTPKISDFGLAKLYEEENTHMTTRVAGTMGYMAPEYALWGHLTYKADVYSFGVLALEIITGKNNTKYQQIEEYICLIDRVVALKKKGNLMDLVDGRLGSNFNKKDAVRIIETALLCINKSPTHRPTMSEVLNMLEGRTKIKEPIDINLIASDDELSSQALTMKLEDMRSHDSISHDYPDSQISEESSFMIK